MNLNKDYIAVVDVKQATVTVPDNMSFYITDIKTANIFAQLVINESNSELIKKYAPIENSEDFYVTLRVIKPNNQALSVDFNLLNQLEAFFMVDLTEEFRDYIGVYNCELFVDCTVNGELERITTSSFTYEVLPSIMNNLDEVVEGDPNYPLVDEILEQLKSVDPSQFATNEYVDEAINTKADIDHEHSNYASIIGLNVSLAGKADKDHEHSEYVTGFDFTASLAGKASKNHTHDDYATTDYIDAAIEAIELTPGPQGEQGPEGPAGADGLTTAISVNGTTYEHVDGVITLPDYPDVSNAGGDIDIPVLTGDITPLTFENIEEGIYIPYMCENATLVYESMGPCRDSIQGLTQVYKNGHDFIIVTFSESGFFDNKPGEYIYELQDDGMGGFMYMDVHAYAKFTHEHSNYASKHNPTFTNYMSLGRIGTVGTNSVALGYNVTASGRYSHAEGGYTKASGQYSHAEGGSTTASNYNSHAEGAGTTASGYYSHAEGNYTTASGDESHAEGRETIASGNSSHAEGAGTLASSDYQHAQGRANIEDTENRYAHIVGNGEDIGMGQYERSNAHTLDWYGNAWYQGDVFVGGTNQDDANKLATEAYVDDAVSNAAGGGGNTGLSGYISSTDDIRVIENTYMSVYDINVADVSVKTTQVCLLKNVYIGSTKYDNDLVTMTVWTEVVEELQDVVIETEDENGEIIEEIIQEIVEVYFTYMRVQSINGTAREFHVDYDAENISETGVVDEFATTDYVDDHASGLDLQYNIIEEVPNTVYSSIDTKGIAIKNTISNSSISMEVGPNNSLVIQANIGGNSKRTIYDSTQSGVSVYDNGSAMPWQPESGYCPAGYFYWEGTDLCFIDPYGNEYRVTLEPK